jgi:hypothetical protein
MRYLSQQPLRLVRLQIPFSTHLPESLRFLKQL